MTRAPRTVCEGRVARMGAEMKAERSFSDDLQEWLRSDDPKTIDALEQVFEEKTFAVAIMLLMFVPALPAPTGGVTHVFEVITIIIAAQMVIGRRALWIPKRWRDRELGALTTGPTTGILPRSNESLIATVVGASAAC